MVSPFHHLVRGVITNNSKVLVAHALGYSNTFLPGGHIEFNESAKDALIREINEELGISCEVGKFLGLVEHKWMKNGEIHCEINQLFAVSSDELEVNKNPISKEDHIEFLWIDVTELENINLQPYPLRDLIKNYLNGEKQAQWASSLNNEIDEYNIN